ncbi:hypothetical protein OE810_12690 [Rhodobacteraceae bacterium XHP0102]|nr:hypothetical protein [Rhodobacteraceae bacterium XHP0102]
MDASEETKFHWSEGMKYAADGIKSFFFINGAAAISILTFVGNTTHSDAESRYLAIGLLSYAFGAVMASSAYMFAYLTELNYGNRNAKWASRFHISTYVVILASFASFSIGTVFASFAFF